MAVRARARSNPVKGPVLADEQLMPSVRRLTTLTASGASAADLAHAICEELIGLFRADASAVFQMDGDDIVVAGNAATEGQRVFTRGARFPLEPEMIAAQIRDAARPIRSARYDIDPSDAGRRITALGYDVVIGAPVHVDGEVWGVIYAAATGTERLPAGTEDQLAVFAEIVTIAVARAEDRLRLEAQALEHAALMRVARTGLEQPGGRDVLGAIAEEAAAMLGLTAGAVLPVREDGTFAAHGDGDEHELAALTRDRRTVVRFGDPDPTAAPSGRLVLGQPNAWGAPIEIGGRFWGVLIVAAETGSDVPPDADARMARFAELSGVVLASVEAREAQRAQLLETERFAALVELSDDFVALTDLTGRTTYLNAGGRRMLGIESLDEARTFSILDYLSDEGKRHFLQVSGPAVREQGSFRGETTLRHRRSGEEIPVSVNAFLIRDATTGAAFAVAVVQHDLRETKRTEQQLREHAEHVERLALARRTLLVDALESEDRTRRQIGDALHDEVLQELYAAKLDLADAEADPEALHRARVAVDVATRQLRDAVSDLHPAVSWTRDLRSRLEAVADQAARRGGFGVQVTCDAEPGGRGGDLVLGIARELLQNVVKHASASHVDVGVRHADGGTQLEVVDDGRGMAPERPGEALRGGHVGLASARERIEALGGVLTIESAPGDGTRVTALVPPLD